MTKVFSSGHPNNVVKQIVIEVNLLLEQTDLYGVIEKFVCETRIFVEIESRDEDVERQKRKKSVEQ